jgi:hypothetical protein
MKIFFHTLDKQGQIDKQGMILRQTPGFVTVQLFSWLSGLPNGQKTFNIHDTKKWRFYESKLEWLSAGDKVSA